MPRKTLSSMHDARDVEDKRLLEAGDHKLLLAGYFHAVRPTKVEARGRKASSA